ncbi:putative calcium transporter [Mytilinidion resinicola]|uniref:Calcium transporter n=1 Tax=Mytilinidion resinicola TaxID=574789 RepID=A0A6A6Z727_9PEZI|nr:putative calcium transporter [Mytilinidion resinicola]KAF2816473.1 putative calcium transporter [Mytilinidion resinicola]
MLLEEKVCGGNKDEVPGEPLVRVSLDHPRHASDILGWLSDPRVVSDATIGLSDGLTVPFALSAGLSTLGSSKIVIFAGLAELIAGAISMGLGGWLAASGEAKAYRSCLRSTKRFIQHSPSKAMNLAHTTLQPYLLHDSFPTDIAIDVNSLAQFLMRFHHNLPEPADTRGAWFSAVTMGGCYFLGGFTPLVPYFFVGEVGRALCWSFGIMIVALFMFGSGKGTSVAILPCIKGGVQMLVLGSIAAGAAMGLVKAFDAAGAE